MIDLQNCIYDSRKIYKGLLKIENNQKLNLKFIEEYFIYDYLRTIYQIIFQNMIKNIFLFVSIWLK